MQTSLSCDKRSECVGVEKLLRRGFAVIFCPSFYVEDIHNVIVCTPTDNAVFPRRRGCRVFCGERWITFYHLSRCLHCCLVAQIVRFTHEFRCEKCKKSFPGSGGMFKVKNQHCNIWRPDVEEDCGTSPRPGPTFYCTEKL